MSREQEPRSIMAKPCALPACSRLALSPEQYAQRYDLELNGSAKTERNPLVRGRREKLWLIVV
jgi:hypothetical protein